MRSYVDFIENQIKLQLKESDKFLLIRLEGFDSPKIYTEICSYFSSDSNLVLRAKLSKEKYEEFKESNSWDSELEFLLKKDFVDLDGAMTKWRNDSINEVEDSNKKVLTLLMGTEVVNDKGGLADFYIISPETVLNKIKGDYSIWFEKLIKNNGLDDTTLKALKNVFKSLFSNINVDLMILSNLIDDLSGITFYSGSELIEEIFLTLNKYWGIPAIKNNNSIPNVRALARPIGKSADIITKSYKFITRFQFKKSLTKSEYEKTVQKIDKYADYNNIDLNSKFPEEDSVFQSYLEFKKSLLEFIEGKNYDVLKEKFLNMDFSIIDTILNLKLEKSTTTKKKDNKILGEPLEVYLKIISKAYLEFKRAKRCLPNKIIIDIESIKLSNCSTEDEKESTLIDISTYLSGLVEYINLGNENCIQGIKITYGEDGDVFKKALNSINDIGIPVTKSAKMNDLSSMKINIIAINEEYNTEIKKNYLYLFKPTDSWVKELTLISKRKLIDENLGWIKIPFYTKCSNMNDYINCGSDEEFYVTLSKFNEEASYDGYETLLLRQLNIPVIRNNLGVFINSYKKFLDSLLNQGYYIALGNEDYCRDVFVKYATIITSVMEDYNILTSKQNQKIYILLNMFLIGNCEVSELGGDKLESVIIPPYHPVMLEKSFYKAKHLKMSLTEVLSLINDDKISSDMDLELRLEYYYKMCLIKSGLDVYSFNNELVMASNSYGKYSLYKMSNYNYGIMPDKVFNGELIDDEDFDKKLFIKRSHKSNIIAKNILDYIRTFPGAIDGINIIFINPNDMQHIVSGIYEAIEGVENYDASININLKIIMANNRNNYDDYLKYWLDNCFENDDKINIKTYLSYMSTKKVKLSELKNPLLNIDLAFIYDMLEDEKIEFSTAADIDHTDKKYPSIFIPLPISKSQENRAIEISQRQFVTENSYLQLLHKYLRPNEIDANYRVDKILKISKCKKDLVKEVHENSNWVVCLDEILDKSIIASEDAEIIGFSTGQGVFGELNTTVSAKKTITEDIKKRLKSRMLEKFSAWPKNIVESVANYCISLGKDLDGLKMLKALNPSDYEIHNYLAYILTMSNMKLNKEKYITRVLISLDNYIHWFDRKLSINEYRENNTRPDFLILDIEKDTNVFKENVPLKIKATVIECKMGNENSSYLDEAQSQIINGIRVMSKNFSPSSKSINKKYWFNQLYRALVFSKLNIDDNEYGYKILIDKLMGIYDGKFEIDWKGKVYAYWLNRDTDYVEHEVRKLETKIDDAIDEVDIFQCGQVYVQKALLPDEYKNEDCEYVEIIEDKIEASFEKEIMLDESDKIYSFNNQSEVISSLPIKEESKNEDINRGTVIDKSNKKEEVVNSVQNLVKSEVQDKIMETVNKEKNDGIRFLLGEEKRTKEKIYWEYTNKSLNNRHLLINGNSGSGKTYCIQALTLEATRNDISVIVFDYTDGFTKSKLSPILLSQLADKFEERYIKYEKFPINPFRRNKVVFNEREFLEPEVDVANRIASSFSKIYQSLGDQQRNSIYSAVMNGIKKYGNNMDLSKLYDELEKEDSSYSKTTMTKIRPLVDYNPFDSQSEFNWKDIIEAKGKMYVIQLSGFDREIQLILTEFILWDIWNYAVREGNENTPIPIVLDEAQNLSHDENSPSGKILAEGRKFGLSGWYATQFMKGRLNSGEIGNLQQAAQKLYFSPPEESIKEVAKSIDATMDGTKIWSEKLSKLTKGSCVTVGYKANGSRFDKYEPKIINITSLEERIEHE